MPMQWYMLDQDKNPIPVDPNTVEYQRWEENRENWILKQESIGPYWISTVFQKYDSNNHFGKENSPWPKQFYETLVSRENAIDKRARGEEILRDHYETWDEATAGHAEIVERIHGGEFDDA